MPHWGGRRSLLAAAAVLTLALPALAQPQEEAPESLLPEGFGDPAGTLPPPASAAPSPSAAAPSAPPVRPTGVPAGEAIALEELSEEELAAIEAAIPKPIEIPDFARRPVDHVGPLTPEKGGLGDGAWGNANGRFLSTLMRRVDAPLPSRWASMLLRRALLSRVPAPALVNPVDWTAERAWLLVRMGEADGARMLVQSVDVDRFTPKMFQIAVQTALATADLAALCPLVEPGRSATDEAVWPLAEAMCAALQGDAAQASTMIDRARRASNLDPIDLSLAEKIVGAGANTRRAVTVQWDEVDRVNSWRFGIASATGLTIPARLMDAASPHVLAWQARAAMVPLDQRLGAADTAASLGVFSNQSLVGMYSLVADSTDPSEMAGTVGSRLRTAYVAPDLGGRMEALRSLWTDAKTPTARHARRILTAVAASRIRPNPALADDADDLIASMLSAGLDEKVARWGAAVGGMTGEASDRAWAMLAVASPGARPIDAGRIDAYGNAAGGHGKRILVAALAGLGRIDGGAVEATAEDAGVNLAARNRWTQALDRAAADRQPATVALLVAAGMQTGGWSGVPPEHLYHMLRALRGVGLDYEARMIAAEAIARL